MKNRKRILLASFAVALFGGLVWFVVPSGPPEPVYNGRPVGWWIRHCHEVSWELVFHPKMDSKAVPYLVKALETRDGALSRAYANAWNTMPLWLQNKSPKPIPAVLLRRNAATLLCFMERDAEPAIPTLVRVLKMDENEMVRACAVAALGVIGKNDRIVTAALVDALKDPHPAVRQAASVALKQLDPEAAAKAGME